MPVPSSNRGHRHSFRRVLALAAGLIAVRSAVWVMFEQSHFDSDQAIVGLMAKHLAEGAAFPLFFYGQHYMLAVEAWLAAPVFKLTGPSVAALKLPLVGINLLIAATLLWVLIEKMRLLPREALAASIFFLIPPPLVSARLVEAQGSNIEPLIYVLVLWLLRERPIVFGLAAGFAFLHREFAAYTIAAIVAIDLVTGRLFTRDRVRDYTMSWGMFAAVLFAVNFLKQRADLLGPGTAGSMNLGAMDQGYAWSGLVCWPPEELGMNVRWLFVENLGTMFGWKEDLLGPENWMPVPTGHWWVSPIVIAIIGVAVAMTIRQRSAVGERWRSGLFLVMVGLQAAFAYAVLGCHVRDASLLRYTLLTLYVPVALVALFFASGPPRAARIGMFALVGVWAAASAFDNVRFLVTYIHRPAPAPYRELANYLESQGVRYGRATYWTAYQLDFLTDERLTIASLDKVRIEQYQKEADQHEGQVVRILPRQAGCENGPLFRMWCFEELDRARGAAQKR